jgi:Flp pilus assembly protein TadD
MAIAGSAEYPGDVVALDALHYTLAGALLMSGQVDKGLSQLKRALSINPRNFMALNDLGLVHEQAGQLEEATRYYQQALEVEPSFTPAAENLKRIQGRNGIS